MISRSFFNIIINNFSEHVFVVNHKHKIVFQTENNSSLLGFSNNEIIEKGIESLFINPQFSLDEVLKKAEKSGEFSGTENIQHKTNNQINITFRVLYKEDKESKENLFIFYLQDNTQQNLVKKDIIKKSLTIENLSKSRKIKDGKFNEAIYEILESSSKTMKVTRVNAWVFDSDKIEIQCIGNFDARENKLVPQSSLPRIAMPLYFNLFETEKIIITKDTFNEPKIAELLEFYLKPNDIRSLMDVPIRIEGEMIGVICFENVGSPREWSLQEQKYGLVAAQILSLTIESHNKQLAKKALELALHEQTILLQEVNHRVKNNLSIVASLMNLQSEKSHDNYHKQLFLECRNRLDSIASVHELIYKAKTYSHINFKDYLNQILDHITNSYQSFSHIKIIKAITEVHVDISAAIPLALIVNELITNAYKHAFKNKNEGIIEIALSENNKQVLLTIKDNGNGFDKNVIPKNSIGMDILGGLIEQINGIYNLTSNEKGTVYEIYFSKK
jgi:two-component sensor histidine kinase